MRYQNNEELADYVNLFVSILICFPEVGTIKFDKDSQDLFFTFILKKIGTSERKALDFGLVRIDMALAQYHRMKKTIPYRYQVNVHSLGDHAVIEVKRDIQTITREEISFLVELYRTEFNEHLVMECVEHEDPLGGDWYEHGNVVESVVETKRITFDEKSIGNRIVVCREAGKVLVFSNPQ